MKKEVKNIFSCSECGYQSVRWLGRCPECGGWNTFIEEVRPRKKAGHLSTTSPPEKITDIKAEMTLRTPTGIQEFDRVTGGGIVTGSLILLAGEPGVGKSTLLLCLAGRTALEGKKVLYISAEESKNQVKMRAERLGTLSENLYILSTTEMPSIKHSIEILSPALVIVDSIQTVYDPELPAIPGSVSQVRENAGFFLTLAKERNCSIFLVGHITKEGIIAGPKVLEHIVDVVLSFEGEIKSNLRVLRATKNRFGSTMEIGVFSMEENGLIEIPDASALFLPDSKNTFPGAVIFPSQEGSRTILVEIQCLVTPTYYGVPKRSVTGLDYNRISMITAVIEKKLKFNLGAYDVYFNTGGGLRVTEPASDIAVALSCISSLKDKPPMEQCVVIGELALTGEIRPVSQINQRVKEAFRLGYNKAIVPEGNVKDIKENSIQIYPARWLKDAVENFLSL
ncbi:MAG: DNA repair protein RadA [Candidatus Omnitrophica bacterium]|nr:DNA repair protein RadA [Candidatus Omnitrophota bacterium]MCM8777241.1 DNA repair protein RadA [Candidatus Omnitrophota bacterium]